jgi:predicted MFS family arabinose efflux permease
VSRRRLFGSLCGLVFLVNLARIVFAPLLNVFITEFGITEGTAGLIATLAWIGSASLRLPAGWLLTRVPRHWVVLVSGGILTVSAGLAAAAVTVRQLMIGAFLMGIASGIYFVAANPLLSELYPERVGRVMGIHGTASQIAAVIAAPFVALTLLVDWRLAFVSISVAAAGVTLLTWLLARRTELPAAGANDRSVLRAARTEWKVILTGVVIIGAASFLWQGLFNFYELFMLSKGLSSGGAQGLLTLVFAAGVPAFFVGGQLADRLPIIPYLLGILVSFVGCVLLVVAAEGLLALAVATTLIGFVIHTLYPAVDTYLLASLPDATRGSGYAVFSATAMALQSTGSSAVGALIEGGLGYEQVFGWLALLLVICIVGLGGAARLGKLPS